MATGGRIIIPLAEPCISNTDQLVAGATLTINISGGGLATVYADSGLTTAITNPLTSDSSGRFQAQTTVIWADDSQAYDCILNYNNGTSFTFSTLYTVGPQTSTSGFAPINSPTFTGVPQAPAPATNDNSNKIATTSYVQAQGFAPLASPTFTGTPAGPTATAGTNTTQLATTAFVTGALGIRLPSSSSSDYLKIGGIYVQWTSFTVGASAGASTSVTWPIAFPTAVMGTPWLQYSLQASAGFTCAVTSVTTTGATIIKAASGDPIAHTGTIFAIGN